MQDADGGDTPLSTDSGTRRSARARRTVRPTPVQVEGIPETVPAFLRKTFYILSQDRFRDIVSWGDDGRTVVVHKVTQFAASVLPLFFKHSNYASFVRQLNMYGFHKTSPDPTCREFRHPSFAAATPELVATIKRKVAGAGGRPKPAAAAPAAGAEPPALPATAPAPSPDSALLASRASVDSLLAEVVRLRAAQGMLQGQIASLAADKEAAESSVAALAAAASTAAQRQTATSRRLERLMLFTYELYRSMWAAQEGRQPLEDGLLALPATSSAATPASTPHFFTPHGLLPPAQFAAMLDSVDIAAPPFLPSRAALTDGSAAAAPVTPGVVFGSVHAATPTPGPEGDAPLPKRAAGGDAVPVRLPPSLAEPEVAPVGAAPSPSLLPSPLLSRSSSAPAGPPVGSPLLLHSAPQKRGRDDAPLGPELADLEGGAADGGPALASLLAQQEELGDAQHTLLGSLAEMDAELERHFPAQHAAFHGVDGSSTGGGLDDAAGLRMLDLDLQ